MNFFERQDEARRHSRTLVILFILAVIAIVIAVNAAMALIWHASQAFHPLQSHVYPRGFFATNTLVTLVLIAAGTMLEMVKLRDGGDAVARMAGGRLVAPASQDFLEKRLLNVVEEMALASGIACPNVYVMDREDAINAFAAGYNPNEAALAVTRGALTRLTRDELQGVVAHEFSHILNGDMRLNVRLIGVIFGIQMLASFGQHLMDFGTSSWGWYSRDDKERPARSILRAVGFALLLVGYIGIFFGRLIKAAVSRQREFLADASAVQFTRNADGIGGALRKIGGLTRSMETGSRIRHPNAELLSHLFLAAPKRNLLSGMFATHPPIKERLRRIYGRQVDLLEAPELPAFDPPAERLPDLPYVAPAFTGHAGLQTAMASVPATTPEAFRGASASVSLAPELDEAIREPEAARAMVYAMLLGSGAEREAQMVVLKADAPAQAEFCAFLAQSIGRLPKSARLPLLDLATPVLKQLPGAERQALLSTVNRLIAADQRMTLTEFVLQTVLSRRLDSRAGRATPASYARLEAVRQEVAVLLSLLAHVAASGKHESPTVPFLRAAASCKDLRLTEAALLPADTIDFARVRQALDRINRLAPLAKPALFKALLAVSSEEALPQALADLLRAICAAIEVPVPPAVAATYTDILISH
ncbi:M48 family metalloprotease [Noviherbaspirillum massiliense]|uniref:M48 family metalloprotease n=1 Tax=Noviherbaspirillum massiliense TaxID=1465823 RepID=UPI0002EBF249|nr:M48 family metalloprotease [Noviherbaspirillum massiliense]